MDDDQSSLPRNGANTTLDMPRNDSAGFLSRLKRAFGFGKSDETLRESLEGVLDRHTEEAGDSTFRADAKSIPRRTLVPSERDLENCDPRKILRP